MAKHGTISHTVTSGKVIDNNAGSLFDSCLIKSVEKFQFTFQNVETYDYFCTVYPWMTGRVIVH
jgi:plastocyanin